MRSSILRYAGFGRPVLLATAAATLCAVPRSLAAHEIPSRVTVIAFVKPEAGQLRVALRAPLAAMRDVDFPQRELGYLDLVRSLPLARESAQLWIANFVKAFENGRELGAPRIAGVRISLPSERTFASYGGAVSGILGPPLDPRTDIPWNQAAIDVFLEYPIASATSDFALEPSLARLGVQTTTVLRFISAHGVERAYQYVGDPGLVRLDPRWHHAAWRFTVLGVQHILGGLDHLLFVLCLVIPFRRIRPLVLIVTAFTVAHSITLASAALGIVPDALWFPPLIEAVIAASVLFMALENIVGANVRRRWMIAFGFGLVHGFAFSFALKESLQFAGSHLAVSLLTFNLGVEVGQILVLLAAVPLISLVVSRIPERLTVIILSVVIAHSAWHWMAERVAALRAYSFTPPTLDVAFAASTLRGIMVLLLAAASAWGLAEVYRRVQRSAPAPETQP